MFGRELNLRNILVFVDSWSCVRTENFFFVMCSTWGSVCSWKKKFKFKLINKMKKINWSCVDSCRKTYFGLAFDLKKIWSCLGALSERDFDSARGLWMLLVACSALRRVWWCVRPWEVFNHLSDLSKNLAVCLDLSVLQRVRGLTFKGFWACGRLLGLGSVFW